MKDLTIRVENVVCKLEECEKRLESLLYDKLSWETPNFWFSPQYKNGIWDGKTRLYSLKTHTFPTGLLPLVLEVLEQSEYEYQILDCRTNLETLIPTEPITELTLNNDKSLRDYQLDAVNATSSNTIRYQGGELPFQRGIINVATSGGKTTIAAAIILQVLDRLDSLPKSTSSNKVFLFITHSKEIATQAKASIENDLDIQVGLIGNGKWDVKPITVALVPTLFSNHKRSESKYKDLCQNTIGFIADECHHATSTSWVEVTNDFINANIRIGLTGTVDKKVKLNEMRLYSVTGNILTKISNHFLIKNGYSAKPECNFVMITYPDIDNNMRYANRPEEVSKLEYPDVYYKGITNNAYRNFVIAKICAKEIANNNHILILVEHLEHGANIIRMIEKENEYIMSIFLHGELSAEERQGGLDMLKRGDVDVLVSTSILDEGVDISGINVVIYARGMKSSRKLLQGIGRGLRKKSDGSGLKYYDFIDDTSMKLLKHSEQRLYTLKEEKFKTKLVDLESDLKVDSLVLDYFYETYDNAYDQTFVEK